MLFFSRLAVLFVVLVSVVDARQPSCAVLFCNATERAQLWLDAAQDEMFELLELSFGGYAANSGKPFPPCAQLDAMLDAIVCFDSDDQLPPATCAAQDCDFCAHCEFYDIGPRDCCKPCDASKCPPGFPNGPPPSPPPVCLALRKWAAIGIEKLYAAYAFRDADDTASAVSYACAAQRALSFVVGKLEQGGCKDPADHCNEHYRHIVGVAINDSFDVAPLPNANGLPLIVATRTIQTFCGANHHHGARHSLLATYLLAYVVQRDDTAADASSVQQLVWPIGGSVPAFDKTSLPPSNECARSAAPSTLVPLFDVARRLPTLGAENFAVVLDGTACCDGFPTHGTLVRTYRDLNPASDCSALTLIVDIDAALRGGGAGKHHHHEKSKCTGSNVTTWSFTYVAHRKSADTYETALDVDIAPTLFVRLAEPGTCVDFAADATASSAQTSADRRAVGVAPFRQPLDGLPITLPPGESVCVGGDRAGTRCTMRSQCGSGLKCEPSLDDASVGFCYDGTWWNEALPCTLGGSGSGSGGDECPYGVCFGAANAHEGGAYPALHAWQAAQCDTPTPPDAERCAALGDWRASMRLDSVK